MAEPLSVTFLMALAIAVAVDGDVIVILADEPLASSPDVVKMRPSLPYTLCFCLFSFGLPGPIRPISSTSVSIPARDYVLG